MQLGHVSNTVEILGDIEVPEKYFNRILTNVQILDEVFGGTDIPGILPGATILLTGFPGAGKSTLSLQLADLFQKQGLSVLYNCGEQSKYVVKMTADRLNLSCRFAFSQFEDVDDLTEYCENHSVDVLIQDSLQTLTHGELTGGRLIKKVGEKLASFSSNSGVTSIIVGHITKGGTFAGPMQLKHDVDAHAHLSFNKETGNRIFELTKNRFGPAMVPYEFFMGANGLDFREMQDVEEQQVKTRTYQKKEACVNKAKELIITGHKLSGYSSQENHILIDWLKSEGYDISGGSWRGILNSAVSELERDGNKITTEKINRREHWFLGA